MAAKNIFSNEINELTGDNEVMDVEKLGITQEEEAEHQSERPGLAGPMALPICTRFIILNHENAIANKSISVDLGGILEILSINNADSNDELNKLQEFATTYLLNLYICIINENEKKFYYLNATSVEGYQQWPRAYLVFDKHNRCFYPFYICDNNKKNRTIFSTNAEHILNLFEESVENYPWPIQPEIIQKTLEQNLPTSDQENVSTINVNYHADNVDNQSKNKIKASGVCNLFLENVQNLMPQVGSQLDLLNYSFLSSEYQLRDNDLVSTKTVCEALTRQLQMLMRLPDLASKTNNIHASMETDETTTVRSPSLNDNEQDILISHPIKTKLSLRLNAQSRPFANIDGSPVTTNNFNEAIRLPKLKLLNQPTRFWHHRELQTLGKGCPAIPVEGARQRTRIQLELPQEIKNYQKQFYIGAHVTTFKGNEHDQKLIVPQKTIINKNHKSMLNNLECLEFNDKVKVSDEFDSTSKGVFSKINSNDYENLRKKLTLIMVNLYQDVDVNKDRITDNKLIWCRLMFAIYIKLSDNKFEQVSPSIYSELIEDTHRTQSLDFQTVFPDKFCERGGQIIFIQLNEVVEKEYLCVHCNGKVLDQNHFQIAKTVLSFETPERLSGEENLEIIISKKNINDWITVRSLYHSHNDHPEPCGVINKD